MADLYYRHDVFKNFPGLGGYAFRAEDFCPDCAQDLEFGKGPWSWHRPALVDGTPGTQVWRIELTFDELPDGAYMELLRLFHSDDTALLEVGEDRPPWEVEVLLRDASPIPWQAPATLRFALAGPPPPRLAPG